MTREAAIEILKDLWTYLQTDIRQALEMAIKALEQEPSGDLISLEVVIEWLKAKDIIKLSSQEETARRELKDLPSVKQEPKTGHCKDCKYFEYDSVAKVDGVPLIVAHEICSRWGDGCRTKEDGYCFLFEPKEGHWIGIDEEPHEVWECDHCGFVIDGSGCIEPYEYRDTYKYCPNCGAKMEGEQND